MSSQPPVRRSSSKFLFLFSTNKFQPTCFLVRQETKSSEATEIANNPQFSVFMNKSSTCAVENKFIIMTS